MSNTRHEEWCLTLCTLIALAGAASLGRPLHAAAPQVDIATIREAWQKRQDEVRSFRCETTVQYFKPKESKRAIVARPSPIPNELPPQQLKDVEYEYQNLVMVDGSRIRFESDAPVEVGRSSNTLFKRKLTSVFDGDALTSLYNAPNLKEGGEILQADIKATNETNRQLPQLMPLLVTFRGNDLDHESLYFDFELRKYSVTPEPGEIDGRQCVILRNGTQFVWVDPARDFVPARLILMQENLKEVIIQCDISYGEHPKSGWAPTEWHFTELMPDGHVRCNTVTQVRQIDVNPSISADFFAIAIPPGTLVRDSRRGPGPPKTKFSVQLTEEKRVELPIGGSHSEIMARAKAIDDAQQAKHGNGTPVLMAALAVVVAVVGCLVAFLRWGRA